MSDPHHHHEHGPHCDHSHEHPPTSSKNSGKALVWAAVATVVAGVGAYLISKLGEKSAEPSASPNTDGSWQGRINDEQTSDKSR